VRVILNRDGLNGVGIGPVIPRLNIKPGASLTTRIEWARQHHQREIVHTGTHRKCRNQGSIKWLALKE